LLDTEDWQHRHKFELPGEKIVKVQFFRQNLLAAGDYVIKLFDAIGGYNDFVDSR
jgi:hypothetical protein